MTAILSLLLAIPGIGKIFAGLLKALGAGGIYLRGRADARARIELAQAQGRLGLEAERTAIERSVARDNLDLVRERLRADSLRRNRR
jgi:hypothetical protein